MMIIDIIGFTAATLTTVSFLPQAIKTLKTKSTNDISFWMFMLLFIGLILWTIYGLFTRNLPVILANSVTLIFAGIILFYLIKPVKIIRVEHIASWVSDIDKMKDFYVNSFNGKAGKKYINDKKQFTSIFISFSSGTRIELMHNPQAIENNTKNHIAFSVGNKKEVDLLSQKLINKGTELISMPRITGDGCYESVFKDPEGNLIEITI